MVTREQELLMFYSFIYSLPIIGIYNIPFKKIINLNVNFEQSIYSFPKRIKMIANRVYIKELKDFRYKMAELIFGKNYSNNSAVKCYSFNFKIEQCFISYSMK